MYTIIRSDQYWLIKSFDIAFDFTFYGTDKCIRWCAKTNSYLIIDIYSQVSVVKFVKFNASEILQPKSINWTSATSKVESLKSEGIRRNNLKLIRYISATVLDLRGYELQRYEIHGTPVIPYSDTEMNRWSTREGKFPRNVGRSRRFWWKLAGL